MKRIGRMMVLGTMAATLGACAGPGSGPSASYSGSRDTTGILRGRDAKTVIAELGRPNYKRFEEAAQVWHYQTNSCTLFLFMYRDGKELKVDYAEARRRSKDKIEVPVPQCLNEVRATTAARVGTPNRNSQPQS